MWELDHKECWALKNWCFELYWRRLLRVPWTQSILKEINPESSLEGLMLKLKLQYFGHLMRWADSLEMTLLLGKIEGKRIRGRQRMRWLDGITDTMDMGLGGLLELVMDRAGRTGGSWGCKESDMNEWLNWTGLAMRMKSRKVILVCDIWASFFDTLYSLSARRFRVVTVFLSEASSVWECHLCTGGDLVGRSFRP